ncbi:hypothetical protein COL154_013990, partial [Colletotrichum chrysophilum]
MKLVGEARALGIGLAAADVFRHPKLVGLADHASGAGAEVAEHVPPFSLLYGVADQSTCVREVADALGVDSTLIEDMYPCTPLQEGLLALTAKQSGQFTVQNVLELSPETDVTSFRKAWEQVVRATPILRTRIAQHAELGLLQVVVREGVQWADAEGIAAVEDYLQSDRSATMDLGARLTRYALLRDSSTHRAFFVWTLHHAVYDGWSMRHMLSMVRRAYRGDQLDRPADFKLFIKHLMKQRDDGADGYWRSLFHGCEPSPFPPLPASVQRTRTDSTVEHRCTVPHLTGSGITLSSLVRAAWALVAYHHSDSSDVVFGATVWGRNASVAGVEDMVGPTIATVPVLVRIEPGQAVSAYLSGVQDLATTMMPYEQTGLQRISRVSTEAQQACQFQTLLVVQPPQNQEITAQDTLGTWHSVADAGSFSSHPLTIT